MCKKKLKAFVGTENFNDKQLKLIVKLVEMHEEHAKIKQTERIFAQVVKIDMFQKGNYILNDLGNLRKGLLKELGVKTKEH